MRASATEGLAGKDGDGRAGTREVKLARLFTVSRLDEDGRPVMDRDSSTYLATFADKDALAQLVEAEYLRRGGEQFRQVVALGDGAAWIWTMAGALYPQRLTRISAPVFRPQGQANSKWSGRPPHQGTAVSSGRSASRSTGE